MAASGLLFAAFEAETSNPLLFTGYVLFGLGFGMVNAPITNTAVSGMPRSQAGVAAAVASTSRQTGADPRRRRHRLRPGRRHEHREPHGRLRRGRPPRLVDHHGLRPVRPGRGPRDERPLGTRNGTPDGAAPGGDHATHSGGQPRVVLIPVPQPC